MNNSFTESWWGIVPAFPMEWGENRAFCVVSEQYFQNGGVSSHILPKKGDNSLHIRVFF